MAALAAQQRGLRIRHWITAVIAVLAAVLAVTGHSHLTVALAVVAVGALRSWGTAVVGVLLVIAAAAGLYGPSIVLLIAFTGLLLAGEPVRNRNLRAVAPADGAGPAINLLEGDSK